MKKHIHAARLLCVVLVVLLACAALVTHSHECLRVRCVECMVKHVFSGALLMLGGRVALHRVLLDGWTVSARAPADTGETLVQMKVKLSN